MQLAATPPSVTQPFRLTVTDYTDTSFTKARPQVDALAAKAGVEVSSYAVQPFVLESMPTQSLIKGSFTGSDDAVTTALWALKHLDSVI